MFNKKMFLSLVVIVALMLSACSPDNVVIDPNPQAPTIGEQNPDKDNLGKGEIKMQPIEVFNKYLEKYPNTKVSKLGLDSDNGEYYYKVEGFAEGVEYEIKIDPSNGDVLKEDTDKDSDAGKHGEITKANLEKIADLVNRTLEEAGDKSKLDEWTLKTKNGRVILEVEVDVENGPDIEYNYDIETGEIIND